MIPSTFHPHLPPLRSLPRQRAAIAAARSCKARRVLTTLAVLLALTGAALAVAAWAGLAA